MRRALLLVLALAVAGCAAPGSECCREWSFRGDDPRLYAALANAANVTTTDDPGMGLQDARLDEAWGEYALVAINNGTGVSLSGLSAESLRVTTGAAPDADLAALRANVTAFLLEVVVANESEAAQVADRLLANATPQMSNPPPHQEGTPTPAYEPVVEFYHYAIDVPYPPRAQDLFREKTANVGWAPEESFGRDQGSVEAGGWTFLFSFPLRDVQVVEAERELVLRVNSHGGLLGHVRTAEHVDEEGARATIVAQLEALGAEGVDPTEWELAGLA